MFVNWNVITETLGEDFVRDFATGDISGRQLYDEAIVLGGILGKSEVSSEVRNLLRERGVTYARRLARKALRRRGVNV